MPNDLYGRLLAEAKAAYTQPVRLDGVRHACPDCDITTPRAFCPTCLGAGTVTEERLARWVRERNTA